MPKPDFETIQSHVLKMLEALSPGLTYHSVHHTLDVVAQAERIAMVLGLNEPEIFLLKVAGLYHDTGFLEKYIGHEEKGCEIFMNDAQAFHFSSAEKSTICHLILATKVPQHPHTLAEAILCDADLDYLGREDFFEIASKLQQEMLAYKIIATEAEWSEKQLAFLQLHHFHTPVARALRDGMKQQHLLHLKQKLA